MAINANQLVPMRALAAPGGNDSGILNDAMLGFAPPVSNANGVAQPTAQAQTATTASAAQTAPMEEDTPLTGEETLELPQGLGLQTNFGNLNQLFSQPTNVTEPKAPLFTSVGLEGIFNPPADDGAAPAVESVGDRGAYEVASMTEDVVGITPETIEGQEYEPVEVAPAEEAEAGGYEAEGYEPTLAPEAEGYEARGYEAEGYEALQGIAKTTAENVSQAIQRITGADSPIMQRAVAQATAEANRRGLLNSSMAAGAAQGAILDRAREIAQGDVQNEQFNVAQQNAMESQNIQMANEALRFTADARNQASAFLANAQNRAAEFLAAERNQNGRFNAEQSNRAAEFSANAQNQASQFLAAAQNQASIFNAGEANRLSMFTAEQANQASRFAAEMQQAASQFNATAFNQAEQRYADAMNAALAAEVDATNQSRRDLAMFEQQAQQNALDREAKLERDRADSGVRMIIGAGGGTYAEEERAREFTQEQIGVRAYETFVNSVGAIMSNPNLTDEGRSNAINTLAGLQNGHPYAQVNVEIGGGGG